MTRERCEDCKQLKTTVDIRRCDYRLCDECNLIRYPDDVAEARRTDYDETLLKQVAEKSNTDVQLYQNELLAYTLHYFSCSSLDTLRKTILLFYTPEEISTAKDVLWDSNVGVISSNKQRRISTTTRAAHEADISDILSAISELDQRGELQKGKYYAVDLSRLPKHTPEESNTVAMLDRLRALELQLSEIKDMTLVNNAQVDTNKKRISSVNQTVLLLNNQVDLMASDVNKWKPTYSDAVSSTVPKLNTKNTTHNNVGQSGTLQQNNVSQNVNHADANVNFEQMVPHTVGGMSRRGRLNPRGGGGRGRGVSNRSNHPFFHSLQGYRSNSVTSIPQSVASSNAASSYVDNNSEFQYPSFYRRKMRRKTKTVTGQADNVRLKGAPLPSRDIFVFRVDRYATEDELKGFIIDNGVPVRELTCVSHADAKYKSFKLTVSVKDVEKVFDEDFWPCGIMVRRYFAPASER